MSEDMFNDFTPDGIVKNMISNGDEQISEKVDFDDILVPDHRQPLTPPLATEYVGLPPQHIRSQADNFVLWLKGYLKGIEGMTIDCDEIRNKIGEMKL